MAVFVFCPGVVPCRSTLRVQDPLAAKLGILTVSDVAPAVGVNVPTQVMLEFGVGATTRPAGRASVIDTPVRPPVPPSVFMLLMRKVALKIPFLATQGMVTPRIVTEHVVGSKVFSSVGGASTDMFALAALPCPPSSEEGFEVVLVLKPTTVPVSCTEKLQEAVGARVAPGEKVICGTGMFVVVIVAPGHKAGDGKLDGVVTVSPGGSVSVKPTPVRVAAESLLGLERLKESCVVSPTLMALGLKNLETFGPATTVISACVVTGTVLVAELVVKLVTVPGFRPTMSNFKVQIAMQSKRRSKV